MQPRLIVMRFEKDEPVSPLLPTLPVMKLVYDQRYVFPWAEGRLAQCWLRVYKTPGRAVVIATEVDRYPQRVEATRIMRVATCVYQRFGLHLDSTVWVAHTPGRGAYLRPYPNTPERFEEVTLEWATEGLVRPQREERQRGEVEALIGQPL
jgi:hypothetical protein